METAPMVPPVDPPCPLCGEPLPKGARRCDNCGSVIPEKEFAELQAFMETLKVDKDTAKRLVDSGYILPEAKAAEPGAGGGTLYLCPSCGAFVSSVDAKCSHCGAALQEETEAVAKPADARTCPHCRSTIHAAAEVCPSCGKAVMPEEGAIPALCPKCGSLAPTDRQTCAVCGTSLLPTTAAEPAAPAARAAPPKIVARPARTATPRGAPKTVAPKPPTPQPAAAMPKPEALPRARAVTPRVAPPTREVPAAKRPKAREAEPAPPGVAPPPIRESAPRLESLRELAAIGTLLALPLAAVASYANAAGREYGQLFLFGALFGLAAGLTLPDLRPFAQRRAPILVFLAGTLMLVATPLFGYSGAGSVAVEAGPLAIGLVALGLAAWRLRESVGVYLPWVAGLLLLSMLAVAPLAFASPGETAAAQWALGGALSLGPAGFAAVRRYLRYAADARFLKADEEYARREFGKAVAAYDAGIALARRAGRETAAGWYGKGAALVAAGKHTEAIAAFDRALALSPENEVAWINKGTALSRLGRMQEALKCYNSAIKVNPAYEVAWNNKGNALARLGKPELALACYERALQIDAAYRTAWVNKGFVLAKLGRFEEAADCADTALRLTTGAAASA